MGRRRVGLGAGVGILLTGFGAAGLSGPPGAWAQAAPAACSPLTVVERAEPPTVAAGEEFTWVITISNPSPSPLSRLGVATTITAPAGVSYSVLYTDPLADSDVGGRIGYDDEGPLGAARSLDLRIRVKISPDSAAGRLAGEVVASGACEGGGPAPEPVEGRVALFGPNIAAVAVVVARQDESASAAAAAAPAPAVPAAPAPAPGPRLPRTGATELWRVAAGLIGVGLVLSGYGFGSRR